MLKDSSGIFFLFTIALRMSNAYALGADQWLKKPQLVIIRCQKK